MVHETVFIISNLSTQTDAFAKPSTQTIIYACSKRTEPWENSCLTDIQTVPEALLFFNLTSRMIVPVSAETAQVPF